VHVSMLNSRELLRIVSSPSLRRRHSRRGPA
jgi:hypothetical protein